MLICTDCDADADVTGKCRPAYVLDKSALYSAQMACKGKEAHVWKGSMGASREFSISELFKRM
jgi:hypothetical protein